MTHKEAAITDWLASRLDTGQIGISYSHWFGKRYETGIAPFGYGQECCLVVSIDQSTDRVTLDYYWTPSTMHPRLTVTFWHLLSHKLALVDDVIFDVINDSMLLLNVGGNATIVKDGFTIVC